MLNVWSVLKPPTIINRDSGRNNCSYLRNSLAQWKESACNTGDKGDEGLILRLGRSLEKEMATHLSILAWEIPQKEEVGGLQYMKSQELDMIEQLNHHHQGNSRL